MRKFSRFFSLVSVSVLIFAMVSLLSGCDDKKESSGEVDSGIKFPLESPITLTMFTVGDGGVDSLYLKELEKKTNIKIDLVIPSSNSTAAEEYLAMVQSQEMTDIVRHTWFGYELGVDKSIDDKVYIDLSKYLDIMPNFKAALDKNPVAKKVVTTPKGRIAHAGFVRDPDKEVRASYLGPIIRKDFLDSIQREVPVTINDWYDTLKAFKNQLKVSAPFLTNNVVSSTDAFLSAYGANRDLQIIDGKVQMGLAIEGARLYTTEMRKWVDEGLLVINPALEDKMFTSDDTGSWIHGFYMFDNWKKQAASPAYRAVASPYPVLKVGDKIELNGERVVTAANAIDNGGYSISDQCKNKEAAAMWLDYMYSKEGILLASYGIENDTFKYDDKNEPQFTDKILKYTDGYSSAINKYMYKYSAAWDDWSELKGYQPDEQAAISEVWTNSSNTKGYPPMVLAQNFMTEDDLEIVRAPVYIYLSECINKMVSGELELSFWDEMISEANNKGMKEQIEVYQRAYEKYSESIK